MSGKKPLRAFCPSCGEEVDVYVLVSKGDEQPHCTLCGLNLGKFAEPPRAKFLDAVFIAEDSDLLRKTLHDRLVEARIAKKVFTCRDGREFITSVSEEIKGGLPVNLVILDVNMPGINGIDAAKIMRALEERLQRAKKIPILFFTVVKCNENFRKILEFCRPSAYLNKGSSSTSERLTQRVNEVIHRLLE
jgi:response regulator RpfG family c-di-GMP phosphodiesterase